MRFFRSSTSSALATERGALAPQSADELGLALRAARERRGMDLDTVRDAVGVARYDLEALETGQLERFHHSQAAVAALHRYAEFLGLDGGPLAAVLSSSLSANALRLDQLAMAPSATPLARLRAANALLSPIVSPAAAVASRAAGLSSRSRAALQGARAKDEPSLRLLLGSLRGTGGDEFSLDELPAPDEGVRPGADARGALTSRIARVVAERFGLDDAPPQGGEDDAEDSSVSLDPRDERTR